MPLYKSPEADLDYELDWSNWLASGETISTSTWTVPAGITEESDSNTTTTATVWLSGGTIGSSYELLNTITTSDSRTDSRYIAIEVKARKVP